MKKALILLFIIVFALMGVSCGASKDTDNNTKETAKTIKVTSKPTAKAAADDVKIKEETVKISKKNSSKSTDPTAKPKPEKKKKNQKKKKKTSSKLPTQGQTQAGTYISVTYPPVGSLKQNDLRFYYKGKYIDLDDDIEKAFKILGEDNSVTELSKTKTEYEYDNVTLVSYSVEPPTQQETTKKTEPTDKTEATEETEEEEIEKPEKIEQINVTTDKLATQKGAKIGMYATKLKGLYGDPSKKTSAAYTYTSGNKSLVFYYENNLVTSYSYMLTR